MKWDELIEEKNKRIEELEAQLAGKEQTLGSSDEESAAARDLLEWVYDTLKPPIQLTADNKLPAVRAVRERLGKYLEKK